MIVFRQDYTIDVSRRDATDIVLRVSDSMNTVTAALDTGAVNALRAYLGQEGELLTEDEHAALAEYRAKRAAEKTRQTQLARMQELTKEIEALRAELGEGQTLQARTVETPDADLLGSWDEP